MKKIFCIGDLHAPYHDVRAFELAMRCGERFFKKTPKQDRIFLSIGDFADCYAISKFSKINRMNFEGELKIANGCREEIEQRMRAGKYVITEGNHEARWPRYISDHAADVYGLFPQMRELLGMKAWTYIPYHESFFLGDAEFTHDTGGYGSTAHVKACHDAGGSIVIGHTHFAGVEYRNHRTRNTYFGSAIGCLADKSQIDYQSRVKTTNWTHGVGTGYLVDGKVHFGFSPFMVGESGDLSAVIEGNHVRLARRGSSGIRRTR